MQYNEQRHALPLSPVMEPFVNIKAKHYIREVRICWSGKSKRVRACLGFFLARLHVLHYVI